MQIKNRTLPWPVLTDARDDYPGCTFGFIETPSTKCQDEELIIEGRLELNCRTISSLCTQNLAKIYIHIECSSTCYRKAFAIEEDHFTICLPLKDLGHRIDMQILAIAITEFTLAATDEMNSDYEGVEFILPASSIIGVGPWTAIEIDYESEKQYRFSSIFSVLPRRDSAMPAISLSGQKIAIHLPLYIYNNYKLSKESKSAHPALASILLLPSLMYVLDIAFVDVDEDEYADRRWYQAIRRKLTAMNIETVQREQTFEIANRILEKILDKAFESTKLMLTGEAGKDE